ncbi:hypothetical protein AgCh_027866 [Apium graveolens]
MSNNYNDDWVQKKQQLKRSKKRNHADDDHHDELLKKKKQKKNHSLKKGDRVQAKHLEGKVVVLHFAPLAPWNHMLRLNIDSLVAIYNAIHTKGGFEVVLVGFTPDYTASWTPEEVLPSALDESFLEERFEEIFSIMPWTAIPFSDTESRNYLEKKLRLPVSCSVGERQTFSVVIDPKGIVLQTCAYIYFLWCGAQAYPFSDERIDRIGYEDEETLNHPSIGLVAFDRDGTAVRRSTYPIIEKGNKDFPFNAGGLEKEALMEVTENYNWDYVPIQEWEV